MPTTKSLRAAPPKNLDSYVASSRKIFGEPETIPDSKLFNFVAPGNNPNTETSTLTSGIPLGFSLKINNRDYTTVTIAVSGWMVLQGSSAFSLSDILDLGASVYENHRIRSVFLRSPHILLAPWFDQLWPVPRSINILENSNWYDNATQLDGQTKQDIAEGINKESWPFSITDRGVRYHRGYDKNFGRYFLCRWTTAKLENKQNCGRIKFECVIFENGRMEFRYWPRLDYVASQVSPGSLVEIDATVGIFWSYPLPNQFRDFATLVDYSVGQRNLSDLGGAPYDPAYVEGPKPYSHNIVKMENWPNNGAVIVFSPPTNPYKVLPQRTVKQINAAKNIVKNPGIFDDRRSVIFSGSTNVFYPTTLPSRLAGDTGDVDVSLRQILFAPALHLPHTSGSIKTTGSVDKAAVDTFLTQLEGVSHDFYKKDLSFNEHQKDYKVTDPTLPFFATGSSLEVFGEGFTSALKSKTQFHFSLPINETTVLPATRSCVLYYDGEKKAWSNIDDAGWREPEAISLDISLLNIFPYERDNKFYYRATETARAFDAVGRKITLSSKRNNIAIGSSIVPTYQRDDIIGLIVNTDDPLSQSKLNEALTRSYPESFTDSLDYVPNKSQGIELPIDYPFLIEKIVVEFPFLATDSWFRDRTTCMRPLLSGSESVVPLDPMLGEFAGPIDFGGPGLTFSVSCARKSLDFFKMDLIASGTITHEFDDVAEVTLEEKWIFGGNTPNYSFRPMGFRKFSSPTTALSGTLISSLYFFNDKVRLEMDAAVSSGITFSRNERRRDFSSSDFFDINRTHLFRLLLSKFITLKGEDIQRPTLLPITPGTPYFAMSSSYNTRDIYYPNTSAPDPQIYGKSSPRIHVHEVHPLSRGSSGIYFNGNSILGGTISTIPTKTSFENPLFDEGLVPNLPGAVTSGRFVFDASSLFTTFISKPSPYLIMPGEKLTFAISKTRPVLHAGDQGFDQIGNIYHRTNLLTSGSHGIVIPPGDLKVTVYGSYVKEGMEYHL